MHSTDTFYADLANRFRDLRTIAGYTQDDVAKLLDVTTAAYRSYEIGNRRAPLDVVVKLANIYKVSVDYMLGNLVQSDSHNYLGMVNEGFTHEQIEKIQKYAEMVRRNLL